MATKEARVKPPRPLWLRLEWNYVSFEKAKKFLHDESTDHLRAPVHRYFSHVLLLGRCTCRHLLLPSQGQVTVCAVEVCSQASSIGA
jgi:hypothetical protein